MSGCDESHRTELCSYLGGVPPSGDVAMSSPAHMGPASRAAAPKSEVEETPPAQCNGKRLIRGRVVRSNAGYCTSNNGATSAFCSANRIPRCDGSGGSGETGAFLA